MSLSMHRIMPIMCSEACSMPCAEDSKRGPDREQGSMAEEDVKFAGNKPDPKDIPHTRYNSR